MPQKTVNYWTIAKWAEVAGIGRTNAYYWLVKKMGYPLHKVGGHYMIPENQVEPSLVAFKVAHEEALKKRKKKE